MFQLTEEQILENWSRFISNIESYIPEEDDKKNRWYKLRKFYEHYAERISLMPASSKTAYHSAFTGGYVYHVNNVVTCALRVYQTWKKSGATIDFTEEELVFSAINHDLGKFGTDDHESYLEQDSDWHYKRGEIYKFNPNIPFMKVQDRSLYILQSIGVKVTENEYLAIKCHDGLYDDGNKQYLSFSNGIKSTLPYILHQADFMAAFIENQEQNKK